MPSTTDRETIRSLLRYWRDGLADAELSDFQLAKGGVLSCSRDEIAAGRLSPAVAARLVPVDGDGSDARDEMRPILLCPLHARLLVEHGYEVAGLPKQVNPLWIPALVGREGKLDCALGTAPWIPRFLLDPLPEGSLALGSVDALDHFLTLHPPGETKADWPAFWSLARELFESTVGQTLETFSLPRYATDPKAYVLDQTAPQGASKHLVALYDHLLAAPEVPPLLACFASRDEVAGLPLLDAEDEARRSARHLGQMQGGFSLSPSQRRALHHALSTRAGEMLAVQGPPGTGKTTLIQSVVASLWIEAAVAAGEPPILLVSSTNNQAVTNVIESFGRAGLARVRGGSLLARRWLPRLGGYGLYCVSPNRSQSDYPELTPDGEGMPKKVESSSYLKRARAFFLACSSRHAGRKLSEVEVAVAHLHGELLDVVEQLARGVAAWSERPLDEDGTEGGAARERALARAAEERARELARQTAEVERARRLRLDWLRHANGQPLGLTLLSFLPPVKRRIAWRHLEFFAARSLPAPADPGDGRAILAGFDAALAAAEARRGEVERLGAALTVEIAALAARREAWEGWRHAHPEAGSPGSFLEDLDRSLRHRAFLLAARYWEGRWLLEREDEVRREYKEKKSVAKLRKRWRRYAKLTPCLVSTLYMAPRFFTAWEGSELPLYDFIDLLVVEEAGQVSPEVAAPVFALAKRALVIGDRLQIEPVHTLPEAVDRANLERRGVAASPEEVERIAGLGLAVSSGSVMMRAERASRFRGADGRGGLRLREHRRCVPEVIAYPNQLAYGGDLVALRESLDKRIVPAMGYAHVTGQQEAAGGSWKNPIEAGVIADWIHRRQQAIEDFYGEPLADALAVVTPFAAQTRQIETALARRGIRGLTVGTVHRLQGGERKIVIFSPVYGRTTARPYFFDRGVNLLNVAVSRARDSFLVFGEMGLFDEGHPELPSGLLARYLFADEANELTDIELPARERELAAPPVERLSGLDAHRETLARAFRRARRRLVIVSPFLAPDALDDDDVLGCIARAAARGVEVAIYTDRANLRKNQPRDARKAFAKLQGSAATVHEVDRLHSKTLCVDDQAIVEGSFNWLSAVRRPGEYQRHESSLLYRGPSVAAWIEEALRELEERCAPAPGG